MKKKRPNQIREELRRQMANNCNNQLERLREEKKKYIEAYQNKLKENSTLRAQVESLEEELKQIKDWNNRLMEFMDIPDEKRKEVLEKVKIDLANSKKLYNLTNIYERIFFHVL